MKNIPYIKQFDENGVLINPIKGSYESEFPNRQQRRIHFNQTRFRGNNKGENLTVTNRMKFSREIQVVRLKDKQGNYTGKVRRIEHYRPKP